MRFTTCIQRKETVVFVRNKTQWEMKILILAYSQNKNLFARIISHEFIPIAVVILCEWNRVCCCDENDCRRSITRLFFSFNQPTNWYSQTINCCWYCGQTRCSGYQPFSNKHTGPLLIVRTIRFPFSKIQSHAEKKYHSMLQQIDHTFVFIW